MPTFNTNTFFAFKKRITALNMAMRKIAGFMANYCQAGIKRGSGSDLDGMVVRVTNILNSVARLRLAILAHGENYFTDTLRIPILRTMYRTLKL